LATLATPAAASGEDPYCFQQAGAEFGISPDLLYGISSVESGQKLGTVKFNDDGSYDYCHMQINSAAWFETLGPVRWAALADPCQCTRTGAWILSRCIQKYGYNWKAVGCYHSQTPEKRDRYAAKVARTIRKKIPDNHVQRRQ